MSQQVTIAAFEETRLDEIRQLFASYFQPGDRLLSDEYPLWLYRDNPFGRALLVSLTEDGLLIGFMAMVPVMLRKAEERWPTYFVVNVLVHPKHHGKNVFGRMIAAAKDHVRAQNAALAGHPNEMAIKSWQRADMHFHEPLRPTLQLPIPLLGGVTVCEARTKEHVARALPALAQLCSRRDRYQVELSAELIEWRYLRHPTNRYRVQTILRGADVVGVQVSKAYRAGLYLLADQLVDARDVAAATAGLPPVTLGLRTQTATRRMGALAWTLPTKKQMPFFCTHLGQRMSSVELSELGLTASDF